MRRIFIVLLLISALLPLRAVARLDSARLADVYGQNMVFNVDPSYDFAMASQINATLRVVSNHAYFYVDDRFWNELSSNRRSVVSDKLQQLATAFDQTIYPIETALWGAEANPGIDKDPHVVILLERLRSNSGGYFLTINGYRKDIFPDSNMHEMVYLSAGALEVGDAPGLLAHEFQHLISFNQRELSNKAQDEIWLNELRSDYSPTAVGLNSIFDKSYLETRMEIFQSDPSDSLVGWNGDSGDYGIVSMFGHYLVDRYGEKMLAEVSELPEIGISAINHWLSINKKMERFDDVFADWMLAVVLNNRLYDSRFGYSRIGLNQFHISPQTVVSFTPSEESSIVYTIAEWQPTWMNVLFTAPPTSKGLEIKIQPNTGGTWSGKLFARYADGTIRTASIRGNFPTRIPTKSESSSPIQSILVALTQGTDRMIDDTEAIIYTATLSVSPSDSAEEDIKDGDLVRKINENDIYVIWGNYRRYIPLKTLALYGMQNRETREISQEIFAKYTTSNYIRADGDKKVYAVWPDGTKHWLNITAQRWTDSGRDWGSIFTVNTSELNSYKTGDEIKR